MRHGDYDRDLVKIEDNLIVMFKTFAYYHNLDSAQAYDVLEKFKDTLDDAYNEYGGEL